MNDFLAISQTHRNFEGKIKWKIEFVSKKFPSYHKILTIHEVLNEFLKLSKWKSVDVHSHDWTE